jgi:hypothetical protein
MLMMVADSIILKFEILRIYTILPIFYKNLPKSQELSRSDPSSEWTLRRYYLHGGSTSAERAGEIQKSNLLW